MSLLKGRWLIGRRVVITNKERFEYSDWGTVRDFKNDVYTVAMKDNDEECMEFRRDEFKVTRLSDAWKH